MFWLKNNDIIINNNNGYEGLTSNTVISKRLSRI